MDIRLIRLKFFFSIFVTRLNIYEGVQLSRKTINKFPVNLVFKKLSLELPALIWYNFDSTQVVAGWTWWRSTYSGAGTTVFPGTINTGRRSHRFGA